MVSVELAEASTEVLEILRMTRKEDVEKIPENFMKFLNENCSKTYKPNFDFSKSISEMNLKPKTQALFGIIYLKYWGDEQGKKEFQKRISENEKKIQEELQEKYSTDKLFQKEKVQEVEEKFLTVPKQGIIKRIINKISKIFKR